MGNQDLNDEAVESELESLLQELRVALPGVQILFAFLLTAPFASRFEKITSAQKDAYFVTLLCTLVSSIFLIAPTSYHRIRWRRHHDPERMLRTFNTLAIIGLAFLALALCGSVFFVTDLIFSTEAATAVTALAAVLIALVWYALPLRRFLQRS